MYIYNIILVYIYGRGVHLILVYPLGHTCSLNHMGYSILLARKTYNLEVMGSNPVSQHFLDKKKRIVLVNL